MRNTNALAVGSVGIVIAIAAILSVLSAPGLAVSAPGPTQSSVPLTVIIPDLSPTPTTSPSPSPSGGPSGGGTSPSPGSSGAPGGTNPDGSPIPPSEPTEGASKLVLDRETVMANEWMIATGTGYAPGEKVQLVLYPGAVVMGSYVADAGGSFSARFRIPEETRPGRHVAEATGWISGHVANEGFTVVTAAGAGSMPYLWWVILVLGVLLAGAAATAVYFRSAIRLWFGGGLRPTGSAP